ncbi:MAG: hypothetical protein ACRD0A_11945 [Acidimicrobiales bacterium]
MAHEELLASWNDTPTRRAVTEFVEAVTADGGDRYVEPVERVAVFDNDGTLWSEKQIPIQLDFTLHRLAEQAHEDPALNDRQPYRAALAKDYHWLGAAMVKHDHGDDADLGKLMAAVERAFVGMSVDDYSTEVVGWFATASHPTLRRPYLTCGFVPMVELLRYLEANGFTTYSPRAATATSCGPSRARSTASPARAGHRQFARTRVRRQRRRDRAALQVQDRVLRRRAREAGAHLAPDRAPAARRRGQPWPGSGGTSRPSNGRRATNGVGCRGTWSAG